MKTLQAVIERKGKGYWVYFTNLPGCVTYGETIEEVMANVKDAVNEHIDAHKEFGEKLPKILENGNFTFKYNISVKEFFKEFEAVNMASISKKSGINASLLRQYATGIKFPSVLQAKKIERSIHQLGKELLSVQF
jgi:predicted RNase H-like HicB family nuclease